MSEPSREASEVELARIDSLIAATRHTLRSSWIFTGAALCLGICLATITAATGLDLLAPLTIPLRFAALIAIVVPTVLTIIAGLARPALRRLSANQMARRIERLVPQIQSRLVTTLDIGHASNSASTAFRQRLISETYARVQHFRPSAVVDRDSVRHASLFASIAVLLFCGVAILFGQRLPTTLARIFLPMADIPPATGVKLSARPGDAKSLKGDNVTVSAIVEQGTLNDVVIEFRRERGKWMQQPMQPAADGHFETTFAQLDQSIEYRLVGGRTWTPRYKIALIDRPAIAHLMTVLHNPDYMKLPEPQIGPAHSIDIMGPIGGRAEIVVDVAGQVNSGEIQLLKRIGKVREIATRTERVWFENKIPDGARLEGNWQWDFGLKFRAAHTEPPAAGPHAHGFIGAPTGFELRLHDMIFTYVHLVDGHLPEEILLQFHDGRDWEHRAFWGADKIQVGTLNTPSRVRMGEIPEPGDWVRLEVPAKFVGLEGKKLHGISFMLFGGQCKWNRGGAVDPPSIIEPEFEVQHAVAMTRSADEPNADQVAQSAETPGAITRTPANANTRWSGSFTLTENASYRVRFDNELGYSNKPMQEGKLTAIPDKPPQVTLDKPAADIVLSQVQRVPLVVQASDDFGLSDVSLTMQKGDSGGFTGAPLKTYDDPVRSDTVVAALDLEPYQLKQGEFVRYRVQARDRKGQIAQTKEYVVRIQQDNNAADRQLASAAQEQELYQRNLDQLITQQATITEALDNMEMNSNEVRQEISKLVTPQDSNIQLGEQIQSQLNQATALAASSNLLPEQLASQMRVTEQLFQHDALRPMRELLELMRQAADPQKPSPDAPAIADSAQRIQRQLELIKSRIQALARARQNMTEDPTAALAQLRMELLVQNAQLTARELSELRDSLDRLAGQMEMLQGRENELTRQTKDAKPVLLPEIDKQQAEIESDAQELLAKANTIMQSQAARDQQTRRRTPANPVTEDHPRDPLPDATQRSDSSAELRGAKEQKNMKAAGADADDEMRTPPGVKQKNASRVTKAGRSNARDTEGQSKEERRLPNAMQSKSQDSQSASSSQGDALRDQLVQRQEQTAQQLQEGQEQLQSPRDRLAQLLEQLRESLGPDNEQALQQLTQLMQSMDIQQAAKLAQALRRIERTGQQGQTTPLQPTPPAAEITAAIRAGTTSDFEPNELDLATRTVLMRMQPRVREELLKGMREDGPEPYRKFIEEYFNRLTKIKSPQ